jgi:hypothetical protein
MDLASMTNFNHQDHQCVVLNVANHSYIPDAVSPIRPHLWPNQVFASGTGVGEHSDPLVQITKYSLGGLLIQSFKLT